MTVAATATEKAKARKALGFLGIDFVYTGLAVGHDYGQSDAFILERSLDGMSDAATYALFQGYLTELDDLESKISTARSTSLAVDSIGKGDVVLNRKQILMLWQDHYLICERLATMLDVEVRDHPVFKMGGSGVIPIL